MSDAILDVTEETFKEELNVEVPVVVDFWAEWCGPCKRLGPILEEVAVELKDDVKFIKANVDNNQEIATEYQVMSIPTIVFFKNGQEIDRMVGAASREALVKKIKTLFEIE